MRSVSCFIGLPSACRLAISGEETMHRLQVTKEGSISWNTPTLNGRAAGLYLEDTDKQRFRVHSTFETAAAAKSWLSALLSSQAA